MNQFTSLALAGVAVLGLAVSASADSLDRAGSLLLYPLFDNNRGGLYTITVTNTNNDTTPSAQSQQLLNGTIDVEFVYINGDNCLEFNRTRRLTPNDTITVTTLLDNPNQATGYAYVFAKSPITGQAVNFDYLIGDSFQVAPFISGGLDIPPIVFRASSTFVPGAATDIDNDGVRDLNGSEYEKVSDKLIVPRFFADSQGVSEPGIILIGLTGQAFTTIINFLIYNDNEEVFSAQYSFDCWDRILLRNINGAFTNTFLQSTNHNPNEFVLFAGLGVPALVGGPIILPPVVPQLEYGWYRMDGAVAFSTAASVSDPAFLAVNVERLITWNFDAKKAEGFVAAAASLPYGVGEQANGDLIQHGPFPDNN
ncbi:MAG: hypothetical protein JNL28_04255 [Planctomycetes bacterium]|nr:hypothetical protein [Planctomycetota bacterium]